MRSRVSVLAAARQDVAAARGLVRAAQAEADEARIETRRRYDLIRAAHDACLVALTDARETARDEIFDRFHHEAAARAATLGRLASACAPGPAGAAWPAWRPSPAGRTGLLRIGTITVDEDGPAVPALVPLLGNAHLEITGVPSTADGLISGLLLRALGSLHPGDLRLWVYDPDRLGGSLAGFAPLAPAGILTSVGPGGLTAMLDELVEQVRRINETVLAGRYATLAGIPGRRPEPWRVAVLLGDAQDLGPAQRAQLDRLVRTGVACGVHLIARDIPLGAHPDVERLRLDGREATCDTAGVLPVRLDPPPPAEQVSAVCRDLADALTAGPPPARLEDVLPREIWRECSATALTAPLGVGPDGLPIEVSLGDDPPHALIGGPSGSGKTNLIYAWLGALTSRYSPAELALYLLDFKEGVSFARFAPSPRDPSWLPHVRLAGVNVNDDREFGLALLRHLSAELQRRARAAKRCEAGKLAELRAEDPDGEWPRIVAVIDEFQVLLGGRDAVSSEAASLLEDLARRGRSQGIHLVLASQDVTGIEALWGRPGLVAQFTLRIALPKARRILAETNLAADVIPRHHAVINPDSGAPDANRIARLPDAGDRRTWRTLQERLWRARPATLAPPRLFDGDAVPVFTPDPGDHGPRAALGERIDVEARPAWVAMDRAPGRNLAVIGTRGEEAVAILTSAALSLAATPGARFSVACPDPAVAALLGPLRAALPSASFHVGDTVPTLFAQVAADLSGPHYLLGLALDARSQSSGGTRRSPIPSPDDPLRTILEQGPERRVHVLGWWRSVSRLRDDLGGLAARYDPIGAWVALDVHGADLAPLSPVPGGPAWFPRPRRALCFDRSTDRVPQVIIPYAAAGR
ncbi:FtsK/SpoIIIE domain-containing protein [Catenuloplanes japonicus]|uniref:FtsK/SpoIIIE domain-containing protein n=1 Tax=Catenuloplanes japonicus TaxID=33876 RepID=UPI0005270808|nr:FtsK/SpoIIIE domain-containing protein [Catenuloplanes japonicus]